MSQDSPHGQSPDHGAAQPTPAAEPTTREILTEPAQMNPISRLVNAVFSPGEMFTDVRRSPRDWIVPILVLVIVAGIAGYLAQYRFNLTPEVLAAAIVDMGLEGQGKTRKDLTEAEKKGVEMQEAGTVLFFKAAPVFVGFILLLIVILYGSAYRLEVLMAQARTTFFRCISVAAYAYCIPLTIKSLLQIVISFIKSPEGVDPVGYIQSGGLILASPAAFVSAKAHPVLFSLLSWVDVFSIWFLALAAIGISIVCVKKVKTGTAVLIVVAPYLLFMLIDVGAKAMFAK